MLAIVIPTYNRPQCLQRLLKGIGDAYYPNQSIPLLISIDPSNNPDVLNVAQSFQWTYGQKTIITHPTHLGLKKHILYCGNLTEQYDNIILLEDDLMVSPYFYDYALQALNQYQRDEQIAGISLYHYQIAENGYYPFMPIDDGSDVYFLQIASSWGQAWTKNQWNGFTDWLAMNPSADWQAAQYPVYLKEWSEHSWKKHFIRFLIETGKYFVFPRLSLTTNTGEPGTNALTQGLFQVPLQLEEKAYRFKNIKESNAIYDAFFEMLPQSLTRLAPQLQGYEYTVDLYATKTHEQITTPYILTTKPVSKAILTYGQSMQPNVMNVVYEQEGKTIKLAEKQAILPNEVPPYKQYYQLSSIAPKIFGQIHQLPVISIVLPIIPNQTEELLQTLQSLISQYYPNLQLIFVGLHPDITPIWFQNNVVSNLLNVESYQFIPAENEETTAQEMMIKGLNGCRGEVMGCVTQLGMTYQPHALQMAAAVFSEFKQVNWLLSTHQVAHHPTDNYNSLPQYRWTKERFYQSSFELVNKYLKTEYMLWRTFLWQKVAESFQNNPSTETFNVQLCHSFFDKEPLFTVLRPIAIANIASNTIYHSSEGEKHFEELKKVNQVKNTIFTAALGKLFKPFYQADIPYLRYLYISNKHLPQVIRHHPETDSYYMSGY